MHAIESFADTIVANLSKNGFPEKKVAFPLERLYESADKKGLSFNRVLEVLAARGITHEKTPEKIVFSAPAQDHATPAPFPGMDGLAGIPGMEGMPDLAAMDMGGLEGMSPDQLMAAASQAAQQMSPEQMSAIRDMMSNMSPEQMSALMEQAKKMGLG
jgi:hypothetical protein